MNGTINLTKRSAAADISLSRAAVEIADQYRQRIRRRKLPKVDVPTDINTWFDPASMVSIPPLAFVFAACSIAVVIITSTIVVDAVEHRASRNLLLAGATLISLVPFGYFCQQLSSILREWSGGSAEDPRWGDFEIGEVAENLWFWTVAASSTAIWLVPTMILASALYIPLWFTALVLAVPAGVYFSTALMGTIILRHASGANPPFVVTLISELQESLGSYAAEIGAFVFSMAAIWSVCWFMAVSVSYVVGFALFGIWWAVAMLLACRLMRRLGLVYVQNAGQLELFD